MSVRLYMDEQVPASITRGLRRRQVDVLTVQEDGRAARPDDEILDRANALSRVLFTQDDDFLREASHRQRRGDSFVGIVYAHPRRVSIGQRVADLELIGLAGNLADFVDAVVHLPL